MNAGGGVVAATTFSIFLPGREFSLKGKIPSEVCLKDYLLRIKLQEDGTLRFFQHGGFGMGKRIVPDPSLIQVHLLNNNKPHGLFLWSESWVYALPLSRRETGTTQVVRRTASPG
eukprot:scaffold22939_cov49-Attheya_sp.AAC.7